MIDDFFNPESSKKQLKHDAIPSVFSLDLEYWTVKELLLKLGSSRTEKDEETDTALEGEGDVSNTDF